MMQVESAGAGTEMSIHPNRYGVEERSILPNGVYPPTTDLPLADLKIKNNSAE